MTRRLTADVVSEVAASHGEGPLWHMADRRLDWVDVGAGVLHRFDPASGRDEIVPVGSPLGAFAPRASGGFVVAVENGFAFLDGNGTVELVAPVDHAPGPPARMNDGKCDGQGRFWAGSMAYDCSPGHGSLYRLDPDLRVTRMLEGVTISNGLDWTDDGRTLFYIDTLAGGSFWDVMAGTVTPGVDAFDVAPETGQLSGRRRLFDIAVETPEPPQMTLPDGMTVDADGHLWIAVAGSGEVRRYSPSGDIEAVVELPVACPTSVAFGGDGLSDLYITTMTPHGAPGADPRGPATDVAATTTRGCALPVSLGRNRQTAEAVHRLSNTFIAHASRGSSLVESAVEETREPWHGLLCCGERIVSSRVLTPREVGDRRPLTHVFGVSAEFLEAERSIRPREEVDTPVGTRDLMACQHDPRLVQARRHAESR